MPLLRNTFRGLAVAALVAGAVTVSACGEGDRTAEAETPVSEAEVSTELPEGVVSDQELQATANAAAEIVATPPAQVVPVPVGGAQATGNTTAATQTNGATTQE